MDSGLTKNSTMDAVQARLVELVQQYPSLWDKKDPAFGDKSVVEDAWETISNELNYSVDECQRGWNSMRSKYIRERKIVKDKPPGSVKKKCRWPYYELCSFLDSSIAMRRSKSNVFKSKIPIIEKEPQWEMVMLNSVSSISPKTSPRNDIDIDPVPSSDQTPTKLEYFKSISFIENDEARISAPVHLNKKRKTDISLDGLSQSSFKLENDISSAITKVVTEEKSEDYYFGLSVGKSLEHLKCGKKKMEIKSKIMGLLVECYSDDE